MLNKRFLPLSKDFRLRNYTRRAGLVDLSPLSAILCKGVMEDLSKEIFDAIRDRHTSFGSLVAKRVPLCLPPRTDTPALYAFGISRFAEIYFAFEETWLSQLSQLPSVTSTSSPDEYEILDSFVNDDRGRIRSILSQLYIPELLRSEKLRSDLRALGWSSGMEDSSQNTPSENDSSNKDNDDDNDDAYGNAATAFAAHIKSATAEHPHLIMVYAWIMYLILLNGGRRIRTKLAAGGHDFWKTGPEATEHGDSGSGIPNGLTFWFFHRDDKDLYDDEGIKQEFKARLHSASNLLSISERAQIIVEAVNIFRHCSRIIAEIDVEVERTGIGKTVSDHGNGSSRSRSGSGILPSIKARLPTFGSGILRRLSDSSTQRRTSGGARLRPVLIGAAGLLGALCAWVWSMNADPAQGRYAFWKSGNNTDAANS
ncbi:hypothetical protein ACJ73_01530 [Blastomyces percursus]|uniref:Heme oxygenase-like protein n=1 Tax=Blastomyces percursus TaxID=1658174 RepID=A0A1J9RHF8_9EURO|nr:hypothetical protein ACJ73_01530 [Blastomyces percursus]